ncbi:MAG: hypothetical protein OXK16_07650 [bacterium]|nr:hypothetical protein [bacterium]
MGTRKFSELVAHIDNDPERRARVDVLEQAAWDELAAHNLGELRRLREKTQPEFARDSGEPNRPS